MSFATMMVHVDIDPPSDARIRLAARLAARFQATLIGACAWEPRPPLTYGGVVVDAKITEDMLRGMSARLDQAGEQFRTLVEADQRVEWRSAIDSPTEFVTKQARAADLLIVGRDRMAGDSSHSLDPGAVVLKAGRPLLAVPPDIKSLIAERIVIGWKDTREARRAVRDSLPLLREASNVAIIEIAEPQEQDQTESRIEDVARYLTRHQVKLAKPVTSSAIGSVAGELVRVAREQKADLIVVGGYGHNRLGEWLFGGVTEELFHACPVCCLLSH
jgi:nucleotide-binding universal stress UspA family protein